MRREGARSNASNASNRSVGAAGVAGAGLPPPLRDSRNSNTTTATTTATSRQTRAQAIQHATAHLATLTNQLQQYQQHQNQQQQQSQQQQQQQQPPPTQHEFRLGQDVPPGIERRHVANLRLVCRYDFTNANAAGGAQQLQQQPASIVAEPDIYPVQEGVNVIGSWPEETNKRNIEQLPVRLQHEIQQQQIMANFDYLATEDPRALLMRTLGVAPEDMESILNIPQSRKASGDMPSRFLDGLPPAASSDQQQQEQEQQQGQGQQQQQQQQQQQHGYRTPTGQQYQHHYQGRTAAYATGVISTPAAPAAPASVCETPLPDLETQLTLEAAIDTSIPSSPPASRRRQQQRVRAGQQPPLNRSAPIQAATLSDSDGSPSFSDASATTQIQSIPAINATHTAHPMADAVPDALGLYTPRTLTTATTATAVTSVHATSSVSAPVISTLTGLPPPSASKSVATDAVTGSRRKAGLRGAGARKNQNQTHNQQAIDQLTPFSTATTATLATAIATDRTNRSGGTIVDTSDLMDASLISSFSPDTRQSKPSTSSSRRGKKTLHQPQQQPHQYQHREGEPTLVKHARQLVNWMYSQLDPADQLRGHVHRSTTTPLATTATTTSAVPSLRPIYGLQLTNATQTISSAAVASAVTGSLRAMITGDKKSFYSNKLRQYGVDLRRTLKLLTAISRGISIVTPAWIDDADSNGGLLSANFDSFMPKGTPMESKYGFVLEMSLRDSREAALDTTGTVRAGRNLLSGYKVYSSSLAQQPAVSRTHSQSSTAALATTTSSAANATAAAAAATAANSGSATGINVESSPDNINKICIAAGAEILKTMPSDKTLAASQYNAAQIVVVVPKAEPAASLVRKMKRWKEYGCLVKIDNFVLDGILLQALDTIGKQHDPKYL
ncbi:hypothetical protein GQ42DRAFT_158757 [Ramicandelaber brevisporus]|nr:hypothetical protein GQ42DRAFT_158757 [Ramicandelaber brevisporus]